MGLLDKLKENASGDLTAIYVEAMDETIYTTPLSVKDTTQLQKKHGGNFFSEMTGEAAVDMIILKALDADGNKMFTVEHKPILMRNETSLIYSIAGAIVGGQAEDQEKN